MEYRNSKLFEESIQYTKAEFTHLIAGLNDYDDLQQRNWSELSNVLDKIF